MRKSIICTMVIMLALVCLIQAADITFTITISDVGGNAQVLVNDFADATGWTVNLPDGMPNPQTRGQWAKSRIQEHVRQVVKAHRANKKANDALAKELTDADALIIFK